MPQPENAEKEESKTFKTFWTRTHVLSDIDNLLQELIPSRGEVEDKDSNPKLERYRLMCNAYYDLFNNGGGNPGRKTSYYFPGAISAFNRPRWGTWDYKAQLRKTYAITEPIMAKAVCDAALEQGIFGGQ